jgi:predicted nuclease of predicted toxin-antitoxin system
MKLLLDENLSPKLCRTIGDLFLDCTHVFHVLPLPASDSGIWEFARTNGFIIASKDNDFRQRSFLHGYPPKVMWLAVGNAGTVEIASLLRTRYDDIAHFAADSDKSLLVLRMSRQNADS